MKTSIIFTIASLSLWATAMALGQANFQLRNYNPPYGVDAAVFDAQGVPLAGANYLAELYGAATPDSLTPLVVYGTGNRKIVPFATAGYFVSGAGLLSVLAVPPRGWAWLQVRAWDARLGATYEAAAARGLGGYGESARFYAQGGDTWDQFPEPAPLIGLQSFSLLPVVPEPSTWALLVLGGLGVWWVPRRK